jgi:hypothetical protein
VEPQLNVRAVVLFFGGPAELSRRVKASGKTLSVKGIEKWHERGRVPGEWIVALIALAKSEGRLFEVHDFITGFKDIKKTRKPKDKAA